MSPARESLLDLLDLERIEQDIFRARAVRRPGPGSSAVLTGLVLAAGGLLGGQLSGSGVWDGVASLLIGALLVYVTGVLGRSNAQLLIGRPVPKAMRAGIREELLSVPHIIEVLELTTLIQAGAQISPAASSR
jgi:divalent metal cation (Fe/Co/Zn/Cd) transporter